MIFIIAAMLTLIGILADDGLTLIIHLMGYGIFETNPIYTRFGLEVMLFVSLVVYTLLLLGFGYVIKRHKKDYAKKNWGYKIQDVGAFMLCFLIVFLAGSKVMLGFHNVTVIQKGINFEDEMQELKQQMIEVKATQPETYYSAADRYYFTESAPDYMYMCLYVLGGFLLYRTGYRTKPHGVE